MWFPPLKLVRALSELKYLNDDSQSSYSAQLTRLAHC